MHSSAKRNLYLLCTSILTFSLLSQVAIDKSWGDVNPDAKVSSYMEQLTTSEDWQTRSRAAQALGDLGEEATAAIPALTEAIRKEVDEVVRLRATFALLEIGLPAIPELINLLSEENQSAIDSAIFALRRMGTPAYPFLIEALDTENKRIRTNILTTIRYLAEDIEREADWLSTAELREAAVFLNRSLEASRPVQGKPGELLPETPTNQQEREAREAIRISLEACQAIVRARTLEAVFVAILLASFALTSMGGAILWWRPDLFLRFGQFLVEMRRSQEILDEFAGEVQRSLKQAGATVRREKTRCLQIVSIPGRLSPHTPLPIWLTFDRPTDRDVVELTQISEKMHKAGAQQVGILVYQESPDTLFRMRMAEVRLRDGFILIPIPLAELEKASRSDNAVAGLLAQYADRYLPGADLFDDRNAIGDTLSFFGRSEMLHRLEEDLRHNQSVGLFGLRKSGKTSILFQLNFAMRSHPVVHIDLQTYAGKLLYGAELFNHCLQQLAGLLQSSDRKSIAVSKLLDNDLPASQVASDFAKRLSALAEKLREEEYELPILIFIDEIERILPSPQASLGQAEEFNAFFGTLRALSQQQRLISIVIADVHPDANRMNQWQQEGVATNPVFSFFKETFVYPFAEEETEQMLVEIGNLMGIQFDPEIVSAIHQKSGGHPFVARQLASLLCKKMQEENSQDKIEYASVERFLDKPFTYSGILKNYFEKNVWEDLKKRQFTSAMDILCLLACDRNAENGVLEEKLTHRLARRYTPGECLGALLWLTSVGLVRHQASDGSDRYQVQVPLMSQWLRMQMRQEEIEQWQTL